MKIRVQFRSMRIGRGLGVAIVLAAVVAGWLFLPAATTLRGTTMSLVFPESQSLLGSTFLETSYSSEFETANPSACPEGQRCVEWCESWQSPGCPVTNTPLGILCCVEEDRVGMPKGDYPCRRPDTN